MNKMSFAQFLKKFKKIAKRYDFINDNESYLIRGVVQRGKNCGKRVCPITAVYLNEKKKYVCEADFNDVAPKLGLSLDLARNIANAADNSKIPKYSPEIREELLKAIK